MCLLPGSTQKLASALRRANESDCKVAGCLCVRACPSKQAFSDLDDEKSDRIKQSEGLRAQTEPANSEMRGAFGHTEVSQATARQLPSSVRVSHTYPLSSPSLLRDGVSHELLTGALRTCAARAKSCRSSRLAAREIALF
ncbi:hypothetical protein NDU88_010198 [Pleurodeles waltl]|uniref:4Fe-4S ferredoxin-type domain-containing protein n=1 Tax=Pleurodeles waltl TaxID=8319 RepID=A0AAV7PUW6_PLEWA|nr:hypothetical protein NDU88_010198 [Pleurodeles waltl]